MPATTVMRWLLPLAVLVPLQAGADAFFDYDDLKDIRSLAGSDACRDQCTTTEFELVRLGVFPRWGRQEAYLVERIGPGPGACGSAGCQSAVVWQDGTMGVMQVLEERFGITVDRARRIARRVLCRERGLCPAEEAREGRAPQEVRRESGSVAGVSFTVAELAEISLIIAGSRLCRDWCRFSEYELTRLELFPLRDERKVYLAQRSDGCGSAGCPGAVLWQDGTMDVMEVLEDRPGLTADNAELIARRVLCRERGQCPVGRTPEVPAHEDVRSESDLAVPADLEYPADGLSIFGTRYVVGVAPGSGGRIVRPRYLELMEVPPRHPTGAREPGNVGSDLELLTDRLTIRHETGGALTWCEAEPIIAAALTSAGNGIIHPWPLGDANLRDHVTPDGHVIRIPRFGTVNAVFEFLFVNEDEFAYQARLETYIEILTSLFARIELQALLESRRRRDPEVSIELADRLIARIGEFADLQEKIRQEALDSGLADNAEGVKHAKRLGGVARTLGLVLDTSKTFAQEEERRQFLSRALLVPVAEIRMLAVLEYVANSGTGSLDPALVDAAQVAYEVVKGGQASLLESFTEAARTAFWSGTELAVMHFLDAAAKKAIAAGLRSGGTQHLLRTKALVLSAGVGGTISGLFMVGRDAWDFNDKVSHFVLLWNAADSLHRLLSDADWFPQYHDLSPEAFRQAPAFSNTLRLEVHRWVQDVMIDDVGLSKVTWHMRRSWRDLRDYLTSELPKLEYWELTHAEFFGRFPAAVAKAGSIYEPRGSTAGCRPSAAE